MFYFIPLYYLQKHNSGKKPRLLVSTYSLDYRLNIKYWVKSSTKEMKHIFFSIISRDNHLEMHRLLITLFWFHPCARLYLVHGTYFLVPKRAQTWPKFKNQNKQLNCAHALQHIWPCCTFLADLQKGIADNEIFSPKKTKKKS